MNIIITGASRGLGYEISKILAHDNQHKILAIARDKEALGTLQSGAVHGNILAFPFDLEELAAKKEMFLSSIKKEMPHVDVLINNAGFLGKCNFDEVGCELSEKIFRVNFFAPVALTRLLLPLMGGLSNSHVVNIGSMGGFQGSAKFPGLAYYSASKAALACFTECLAAELSDTNISFNCLALGSAQTEMLEEAFPDFKAPLQAHEMATYIADFAINGQKYFNGKIIPVSISTP
ncbi:MAG: SDR family oxidoreductase [Bacteroidales bacterium]|nr:SDR family oxidoreductase [Bacteroidales bacterium]MCF8454966.1 SDR family oxidoreductase [Bacteroidales bacterium]